MLANRSVVFRGDSLMRQVFLRAVAWMRGQSHVVDFSFHGDALYLATRDADLLLALPVEWPAHCALDFMDGREDVSCQNAREGLARAAARAAPRSLWKEHQLPPMAVDIKLLKHAKADFMAWALPHLREARWRRAAGGGCTRWVFSWDTTYLPKFWQGPVLRGPHAPAVLVAGAVGGHVPCWSNGKHGNRCSIERVSEREHAAFWATARRLLAQGAVRALLWLTFPFGHPGSRYQNGNYSGFNERARREVREIRREREAAAAAAAAARALVYARTISFERLLRRPGLFPTGVLAERTDTTHFMCIVKGATKSWYPYQQVVDASRGGVSRLLKVRMTHDDGSLLADSEVSCMKKTCQPSTSDGCTDRVNLLVVLTALSHMRAAYL